MSAGNFIKQNFVLIVGISLPVLLVVLFFVATVIPKSMTAPPQYELLFSTTRYDYQNPPPYNVDFVVRDGRLKARISANNNKQAINYNQRKLMAYDGKTGSVREIVYDLPPMEGVADGSEVDIAAAANLTIDTNSKAPDGYEFDGGGYRNGGFITGEFFGGSYRNGFRVKKGTVGYKIPPAPDGDYYGYSMLFIGWVVGKQ
jgi:hypothetical protein